MVAAAYLQHNGKLKAIVDAVAICYIVLQIPVTPPAIAPQGKHGAAFQVVMAGRQWPKATPAGRGSWHGMYADEIGVAIWGKLTTFRRLQNQLKVKST